MFSCGHYPPSGYDLVRARFRGCESYPKQQWGVCRAPKLRPTATRFTDLPPRRAPIARCNRRLYACARDFGDAISMPGPSVESAALARFPDLHEIRWLTIKGGEA